MATAQASIIITAKDQASQTFQQIFAKYAAAAGPMANAQRVLNQTSAEYAGWLRQQADAATRAQQPNALLAKTYTDMANNLQQSNQGIRIFGMNIVDIAAKLYIVQVAIRNVVQAMEGLFQLAELGAQVKQQELAFRNLVEGSGKDYLEFMDELRDKSGGLLTDFELQQKASNAIIGTTGNVRLAMIEALPSLVEFSRAFAALHPDVGSAEYVLNSLVIGIRRSSPRLIDNALIYVRLGEAVEAYAKSVGKSSEELTQQEMQLAIINATMTGGNIIVDQAGNLVNSLTDAYSRLRTELKETKEGAGSFLDAALRPTIEEMTKQLGVLNEGEDAWVALGEAIAPVIKTMYDALGPGGWLNKSVIYTIPGLAIVDSIKQLYDASVDLFRLYKDGTEEATSGLQDMKTEINNVADETEDATLEAEKFADVWSNALDRVAETHVTLQQKWLDKTRETSENIAAEAQKFEDRIAKIHADAAESRFEVDETFNERGKQLDEQYYEQRTNLEGRLRDLKIEFGFETPELTGLQKQKAWLEGQLQTVILHPTWFSPDAAENFRQAIAKIEAEIEEERKKAQVKALEDEIAALDKRHETELQKLRQQAADKLAIISENEAAATDKAKTESQNRIDAWQSDLVDLKTSIETDFKQAWLDAMTSVTEKGSEVNQMLRDQKLLIGGMDQATIDYYRNLEQAITGPAGIVQLATMLGILGATPATNEKILRRYLEEIGGRQHGGPVTAGGGYLVGEAGPELFWPSQSGMIVPYGGFGGVSVTIQAGAFLGSTADAQRLGNQIGPIVAKWLQTYNSNDWAMGSRRTATR